MTLKSCLFFGVLSLSLAFFACKKEKKEDVVSDTENKAPTCTLTSPTSGSDGGAPLTETLSASASDQDGTIAKVEFYVDDVKVGTDMTSPYSIDHEFTSNGFFNIKAIAYDNDGATGTSAVYAFGIGF